MVRPKVSEKTLELNICEEILARIRRRHPKAFWYGPSTREEFDKGYDASLEGAKGMALFLQFKRPSDYPATNPKSFPYWFKVETRQHNILYELAQNVPGAVKYAFPFMGDLEEVRRAAPRLERETLYCLLDDVGCLESPPEQHDVEVYRDKAIFHSVTRAVSGHHPSDFSKDLSTSAGAALTIGQLIQMYEAVIRRAYGFPVGAQAFIIESTIPRALFVPISEDGS